MKLKILVKSVAHWLCLALVFPHALTCGFGRIRWVFTMWAHALAMSPGLPGDYLRVAFYRMTLTGCHPESRIQFGSFFSTPDAVVARLVYVGSYCVLGKVSLGERTQIGSAVQILSGRKQHARGTDGRISGSHAGTFERVSIGADCWIGAQAIVMADVGDRTTIGAGAVVVKPAPAGATMVGNPARMVVPKE